MGEHFASTFFLCNINFFNVNISFFWLMCSHSRSMMTFIAICRSLFDKGGQCFRCRMVDDSTSFLEHCFCVVALGLCNILGLCWWNYDCELTMVYFARLTGRGYLSPGERSVFLFRSFWPLATLWLTDETSQSAPGCKHASLDRPVGCPSKTVL